MISELPLVTVVIPTYNQAKYLEKSINSILGQSYENIELIVVNDGSTDDSMRVLDQYCNDFSIIHQDNAGQSASMNRGWDNTSGEILSYLSSDDILKPEAVSHAVTYFHEHMHIDMVYGDYDLIDDHGNIIKKILAPEFDYHE